MEDDLDDLLDEVERKFCSKLTVSASGREDCGDGEKQEKRKGRKQSVTQSKLPVNSDKDDLDTFLDKLLEEDSDDFTSTKTETPPEASAGVKTSLSQSGKRKCCPVFIGGSSVPNGIGTATSKRSCDQLRCTSCDFTVLMFNDCEWDQRCDYLFFRNNMPEQWKLEAKLKRRRGVRSYCCQCSWTSVSELTELMLTPRLRWVCAGKHLD